MFESKWSITKSKREREQGPSGLGESSEEGQSLGRNQNERNEAWLVLLSGTMVIGMEEEL